MYERKKAVESSTVPWRALQGNVYLRTLHPAMLSKKGYISNQKARLIGNSSIGSQVERVVYDRDYVVNYLISRIIKPLDNQSLETLISLLTEAYIKEKNKTTKIELPDIDDDE